MSNGEHLLGNEFANNFYNILNNFKFQDLMLGLNYWFQLFMSEYGLPSRYGFHGI